MNNYLSEAFKKLDILDEDVFELDKDGLTALKDFEDSDEDDMITVVDPDAESEEDLEDSYIGKVILDCSVCHTDIYKDKEDITIDEESGLANIGEECPYCYSSDGFKVIGEVKPFVEVEVDTDDDVDVEVDGEEVEEEDDEDEEFNESISRRNRRLKESSLKSSDSFIIKLLNKYARGSEAGSPYKEFMFDNTYAIPLKDNMKYVGKVRNALESDGFSLVDSSDGEYYAYTKITDDGDKVLAGIFYNAGDRGEDGLILQIAVNPVDEELTMYFDESLNEKNLKESCSISQCQKWVDYDMKKYKKISDDTMKKIKSSGYSVVKDQYGEYEVITDRKDESCGKRKPRKMKESIEDITIDTGDQEITVSAKDKEKIESDGEMIAPLSNEVKADIETGSDDTVDVDVDEFSEEDFDELGESYLKKVYENVDGYKTTSAKTKGNKLYVEGLIKFNSGKQKKTSFVFESRTITKTGKAKLIGENLQISRGHKSFKLTGTINNGKFISESLNYNYRVKNGNSSQRVYGTAKKSK